MVSLGARAQDDTMNDEMGSYVQPAPTLGDQSTFPDANPCDPDL